MLEDAASTSRSLIFLAATVDHILHTAIEDQVADPSIVTKLMSRRSIEPIRRDGFRVAIGRIVISADRAGPRTSSSPIRVR